MQVTSPPIAKRRIPHLTQRHHRVHNPDGLENSENCGPTSLALSLDRLDLRPRGYQEGSGSQALIDKARFAMFSDDEGRSINTFKDGVHTDEDGAAGERHDKEHFTLTNLGDLQNGAKNSGASSRPVENFAQAREALSREQPVVIAGNPSLEGAHGNEFDMNYDGGHFICLTGYDKSTELYRVHDPLLSRPVNLNQETLEAFSGANIFPGVLGLAFHKALP